MRPSIRWARTSLLLLLSGLSGSVAAPPSPLAPPPKHFGFNRYYTSSHLGYVFRAAYFTPAQIADPAWEAERLRVQHHVIICRSGEQVIHRDVVWYPARPGIAPVCGAIVYTIQCDVPNLAPDGDLEQDRREALRFDADPAPAGASCGEKDYRRKSGTPVLSDEERMAALLAPSANCAAPPATPANPVRLHSESRLHFSAEVNPAFAAAYRRDARILSRAGEEGLRNSFWRAQLMLPRIRPSPIVDDGINILVTQTYAMDAAGRPYCVQLTARQGGRLWRRTITRSGFADYRLERAVGYDVRGLPNDSSRYWNPESDIRRLMIELANMLARTADSVYRRDRAQERPAPAR